MFGLWQNCCEKFPIVFQVHISSYEREVFKILQDIISSSKKLQNLGTRFPFSSPYYLHRRVFYKYLHTAS